jgi:flagellar biosynthesis GTPase FlhF
MSTPGDVLEALGREARARLGRSRGEGTRTYRGRTIEELIPQIERDLGADALIVSRRDGLTGGVMGFFQHPYVEIEAMPGTPRLDVYDEPPAAAAHMPEITTAGWEEPFAAPAGTQVLPFGSAPGEAPPPAAPQAPYGQSEEPAGHYVSPELAAMAYAEQPPAPPAPLPSMAPVLRAPHEYPAVPERFEFHELLEQAGAGQMPQQPEPEPERRTVAPGSHGRAAGRIEKSLLRYGISAEFAAELIEAATAHTLPLAPRAGLAQAVLATLARRIPVAPPLPLTDVAVAVVGAGGSGKTTCAASMLAAYRSGSTLRASCASLLAPEGEQMQMLLSPQIVTPLSLGAARAVPALRSARREGLMILDAPGISPAARGRIRELARLLSELAPDRVVVALPATLGATAADQLLSALAPLRANALAVTHADETDQIGVAIEAACRHGLAPEYLLDRARGGGWALRRVDPAELAGRVLP